MAKTLKTLHDPDGGYASRKLRLAIGTSAGIFCSGVLAAWFPAFRPSLEVVVGGLVGVLAIYSGANLGGKLVIGKAGLVEGVDAEPKPEPKPPVEPLPE